MFRVRVSTRNLQGLQAFVNSTSDSQLRTKLRRIRGAVLGKLSEEYLEMVLQIIDSGQAAGPALSPEWSARKGHSNPWTDNLDLRNAIVVRKIHHKYRVGVPETAKNRDGQALDLIALLAEVGSLKQPGRPVFEPAARKLNRQSAKPYVRIAQQEFVK